MRSGRRSRGGYMREAETGMRRRRRTGPGMRGRAAEADGDAQTEAGKDAQAQVYGHVAQPRAGDEGGRACAISCRGTAAVRAGGGDGDAQAWVVKHLHQRSVEWCSAPAGHCRRRSRDLRRRSRGRSSIRGGSSLAYGGG